MPLGDGTGPFRSGCGNRRNCGGYGLPFFSLIRFFVPRGMGILGTLIPIAGAVIRDLADSNGLLRSMGRKLLAKDPPDRGRRVNAAYTIINERKCEQRHD
jgi:hypothetical protein